MDKVSLYDMGMQTEQFLEELTTDVVKRVNNLWKRTSTIHKNTLFFLTIFILKYIR